MKHVSVLLNESINCLNVKKDGTYVDATLGYAGHSSVILSKLDTGFLYGIDQDDTAIRYSNVKLSQIGSNYCIIKSNFANIKEELHKRGVERVDGILFDLGVSSVQLDEADRGFSFHNDAKLDMRMDRSNPISAYNVVNEYSLSDLTRIIRDYGEEKYAYSIAKKIVEYRNNKKIETTLELVDIIKSGMPMKAMRNTHPARRTFQAIRIEVNKELEVFEKALYDALELIDINGRICVITFHSLEDKICKRTFKEKTEINKDLKNMPVIPDEYLPNYKIVKVIEPTNKELEENNRSRSSKLRIIERIK